MAAALSAILHRLELLEKEVVRLGDENTVLRRCLADTGALRPEAEAAARHRVGFEQMCARAPIESEADLGHVAQPEVFEVIIKYAGARDALARASSLCQAMVESCRRAPLKGVVYAVGGHGAVELNNIQNLDKISGGRPVHS